MGKFERFYEQELYHAKELAKAFAEAHPNIAPLLREKSSDPDVERLLEGVAFLSAQIKERIDDQVPEFSRDLIEKFFPHYLRPLPSATMIAFTPNSNMAETRTVKAGTSIMSIPVDGTRCAFQTCYDIKVHPLVLESAEFVRRTNEPSYIQLDFNYTGASIEAWDISDLPIHFCGSYGRASDLLIQTGLRLSHIEIQADGEEAFHIDRGNFQTAGFDEHEALLPYPGNAHPAYRLLQEFFVFPEKFLTASIQGLDGWLNRGKSGDFNIKFYLHNTQDHFPEVRKSEFCLHTVPALNLFKHQAEPVKVNHKQYEYRIIPDHEKKNHVSTYAIRHVQGFRQGVVKERHYKSVNDQGANDHTLLYKTHAKSSLTQDGQDLYLSLIYRFNDEVPAPETLSIELDCTNGHLPEVLAEGEICHASSNSPESMQFHNLYAPSPYKEPPEQEEWMWRLQSLLSLNYLSIANTKNIRDLLTLYLRMNKGDHVTSVAYEKRIEGIVELRVNTINELISGVMMRGHDIEFEVDPRNYLSTGDFVIFSIVMNHFFAAYSNVNSFTRLSLINSQTGERLTWPIRMGEQLLI